MIDVKLPDLAEGITEAIITYWHVQVGDDVKKDADLVELATDKATFNMPTPADGKLIEVLKQEGDKIKVGEVIARIEEEVT